MFSIVEMLECALVLRCGKIGVIYSTFQANSRSRDLEGSQELENCSQ